MNKLMLSLAAVALVPSWAAPAAAQAADPQGVQNALATFANAFNARDAKAAAAAFDDQGIFVNAQGVELKGREAIEKSLAEGFAGPLKDARLALTAETIRTLTPEVAFQSDLFYLAGRKDAAGKEEAIRLSHYLTVWVKRPGGWRIAALQAMIPAGR